MQQKKDILTQAKDTVKHWYMPLIVGVFFVVVGLITLTYPEDSYLALSILFALAFVFIGAIEMIFSFINRKEIDGWGWVFVFGILTFIIGVFLLSRPDLSMATLPFFVGFVVLFRSIQAMGMSFSFGRQGGPIMVIGVIGVILGLLMLFNPVIAGMTIVIWTGLGLIVAGILNMIIAFKLKGVKNWADGIEDKFQDAVNDVKSKVDNVASDVKNKVDDVKNQVDDMNDGSYN